MKKIKTEEKNRLIVLIRIAGKVKVRKKIEDTLDKLRLRRKYACTLLKPTKDLLGMIEKVRYYISFGEIEEATLIKLLKARAQREKSSKSNTDKPFKAEEVAKELILGKSLKELGFKPFFRLHPPRGGIESKKQYTRGGVLGPHKEINKLIERML